MAADGYIVINTKINTQGFEDGQKKIEAAAQRMVGKLKSLNSKLTNFVSSSGVASTFSSSANGAEEYSQTVESAANKNSQFTGSLSKLRSSLQSTDKGLSKGLRGIMRYAFEIETLFALFRKLRQAMTEGFQNLAKYDSTTNKSLSSITSSLTRLKNSLATAFAPILNYVAPIITKFIDLLSSAATYVGMFFAAVTGQKTFTKAIAVQTDYAASLSDTASAANKAKKALDNLSGLDEINKWQSDTSGSTGTASGGTSGTGTMFETIELPFQDIDWKSVGAAVSDGLINLFDFVSDSIDKVDWGELPDKVSNAIRDAFEGFDWSGTFKSAGRLIGTALSAAIDLISGIRRKIQEMKGKIIEYFMPYIHGELSELGEDASIIDIGAAIFNGVLKGITDAIKRIGKWIRENILKPFIDGFKEAFEIHSPSKVMREIGGYIMDGLIAGIRDAFVDIGDILSSIKNNFKNAWVIIKNTASEKWTSIKETISQKAESIKVSVSEKMESLRVTISDKWTSIKNDIATKVENVRANVSSTWSNIKDNTKSTWENIKNNLSEKWNSIKTSASQKFSETGSAISTSWTNTKNAVTEKVESLRTTLSDKWTSIKEKASDSFSRLKDSVVNIWTNTKSAITEKVESLKTALSEKWTSIKDKASNAFSSLKDSVVRIMTSLKDALKTPINGIIGFLNKMISGLVSGINNAISALNKINVTIPSWVPSVGGKTFGFNIKTITAPQIPYLATGAVIPPNAPFTAVLGDQRHGNNIEAPESLIRQIVREESGGSGNTYNVSARANGRTIFEMVIEEGKRQQTTTGRNPFELAY